MGLMLGSYMVVCRFNRICPAWAFCRAWILPAIIKNEMEDELEPGLYSDLMGARVSKSKRPLVGSPYDKDYSILGSLCYPETLHHAMLVSAC